MKYMKLSDLDLELYNLKMTSDDKSYIINEFYIPELVPLEVLHVHKLKEMKKRWKMTLTMTLWPQDDPWEQKQYQKWILHTWISTIRGITRPYSARNKEDEFSNMAGGGHIGFVNYVIRGVMADKHLGDFSCPGTHWSIGSEKLPQHHFANGT